MDLEGNWKRIKAHRDKLLESEISGLAKVLYRGQEDWLCEKLRIKGDVPLVLEFLGHLGQSGSFKAVDALLQLLDAREDVMQVAVAEALKRCPSSMVLGPLVQRLQEQKYSSVKAGEILLSFGPEGAFAIWRLWFGEGRPSSLRSQILQLLAEAKDARTEALAFLAFLSDEEELIRIALKAAENVEAKSLWGNVAECLKNTSWRVRGGAAQLLGKWGEREALAYLRDMGSDPDPWVEEERRNAMTLLSQL